MKANTLLYLTAALLLVVSVIFFVLGSSFRGSVVNDKVSQLSYTLGLNIGKSLGDHNIDINISIFLQGLDDGLNNRQPILAQEQMGQAAEVIAIIMKPTLTEENMKLQAYEHLMMKDSMPGKSNTKSPYFHGIYQY